MRERAFYWGGPHVFPNTQGMHSMCALGKASRQTAVAQKHVPECTLVHGARD